MGGFQSGANKDNFSGTVKKSIVIHAPQYIVWKKISNIVGLPEWVIDVKKTVFLSNLKRGIGAIRKLTFNDGNVVKENVVGWKDVEYFSYIAVSGLPLRGYHATLSIKPLDKKSVQLTWKSFFNSEKMTKSEFNEFISFMNSFYLNSLKNLKSILEK